ncbi:MAG: redoxin domain-containing protein, partial [Bacteroidota bacterium]|nr:redoxin domain-containing protein [Bacteroidota bacterium]
MRAMMMLLAVLAVPLAWAQQFIIHLSAPDHAGEIAVLSRYDDLITMRTIRLAEVLVGDSTVISGEANGTQKIQLRIGDLIGDLYVRPGSDLHVTFPKADPGQARSLGATARVVLEFTEISPFDINALVSDLNDRVDAFISEDLATDEAAGMQAVDIQRRKDALVDTTGRPPTLFVSPALSAMKVDSFAMKLDRFYADVNDPWFKEYLDYSIAGLRHGPRVNDRALYDRYLKGRPVLHENPEYIRFMRSFFEGELEMLARREEKQFKSAMSTADLDSLHALFSHNEFLKNETILRELVLIEQFYVHFHHPFIDRKKAQELLALIEKNSTESAHRKIAANMLWDLTAMRAGAELPPMLLEDMNGDPVQMEEFSEGPLVIAVSAGWCTYCQLEIAALERLAEEYDGIIPIVAIGLDGSFDDLKRYVMGRPHRKIRWLHASAEQRLRDDLRIRSLPAF